MGLPDILRSNFAQLLISLHMDCDPLETQKVPEMTRVFATLQPITKDSELKQHNTEIIPQVLLNMKG